MCILPVAFGLAPIQLPAKISTSLICMLVAAQRLPQCVSMASVLLECYFCNGWINIAISVFTDCFHSHALEILNLVACLQVYAACGSAECFNQKITPPLPPPPPTTTTTIFRPVRSSMVVVRSTYAMLSSCANSRNGKTRHQKI